MHEAATANCVKEHTFLMDNFFNEVEEIMEMLNQIQANVDDVKRIHSDILSSPESDEGELNATHSYSNATLKFCCVLN